ncbi:MAG: BlaI/MecI/CopY family transcriptional regulator [Acidimicrobiales bacterium]|nr:BlaI/MecI/CopY family transcriptional regulator [Hyphomonadaceae bacterium]RZV45018.1 MAG: BlaI/MecI/CopY family transcriptional regulator [Acidimicrobiales bacterium]
MARPKSKTLTLAEQRIMNVLWSKGEASVREITEDLSKDHDLAYTTVLTTTRILADKGYVGFRKNGRTHIYAPLISRKAERTSAVSNMLRNLFDGSPRALAQHLIEEDKLTPEDIQALRNLLDGDKS